MPEIEEDKPVAAITHAINSLNEQPASPEAAKPGRLERMLERLRETLYNALGTPNNPSWRIPEGISMGQQIKMESVPPTLRTGNVSIDYSRALAQENGIPAEDIIRHRDGFPAHKAWAASFETERARK